MTQLRPQSPPPPFPSPLTEEDFLLIRQAGYRRQAVRKVAAVARSSAVCILLVAAPALVFYLLSPSWVTLIMLIVTANGVVEYMGHRKLVVGEARACRMLAINQLVLLGAILIYCAGMIAAARKGAGLFSGLGTSTSFDYALYVSVAVISIAFQGGLALYYFRRRKVVEAYNQAVPEWIQRLFREIA